MYADANIYMIIITGPVNERLYLKKMSESNQKMHSANCSCIGPSVNIGISVYTNTSPSHHKSNPSTAIVKVRKQ